MLVHKNPQICLTTLLEEVPTVQHANIGFFPQYITTMTSRDFLLIATVLVSVLFIAATLLQFKIFIIQYFMIETKNFCIRSSIHIILYNSIARQTFLKYSYLIDSI